MSKWATTRGLCLWGVECVGRGVVRCGVVQDADSEEVERLRAFGLHHHSDRSSPHPDPCFLNRTPLNPTSRPTTHSHLRVLQPNSRSALSPITFNQVVPNTSAILTAGISSGCSCRTSGS